MEKEWVNTLVRSEPQEELTNTVIAVEDVTVFIPKCNECGDHFLTLLALL